MSMLLQANLKAVIGSMIRIVLRCSTRCCSVTVQSVLALTRFVQRGIFFLIIDPLIRFLSCLAYRSLRFASLSFPIVFLGIR
jgi:hypothetical protein